MANCINQISIQLKTEAEDENDFNNIGAGNDLLLGDGTEYLDQLASNQAPLKLKRRNAMKWKNTFTRAALG